MTNTHPILRIVVLKGLPASGKSTWAKEQLSKGNWVRINKDDLRAMCHNGKWSKDKEKDILAMRDAMIEVALGGLKNVIVDDTNLSDRHQITIQQKFGNWATIEINDSFLAVPVEECIERDSKRQNPVGKKVIMDMHRQFIKPLVKIPKQELPNAFIFDIDGTLAHMAGRSPYDYTQVHTDTPDFDVVKMSQLLMKSGYKIFIVSGREDSCRGETYKWLEDNGIKHDGLFMRKAEDARNDTVIKSEIYSDNFLGRYNIEGVFDDRDRVVNMWRELGLTVYQVAEGNF